MSRIRSAVVVVAFATASSVVTALPAGADPVNAKNGFPLTIACDNGHTYDVVANGNGTFSPAHDVHSTATLIPVWFGLTTFTVTDPADNVVDQFTEPADAKGASTSNPNATTSCSFTGSSTDENGFTLTFTGTVIGFVTPARSPSPRRRGWRSRRRRSRSPRR